MADKIMRRTDKNASPNAFFKPVVRNAQRTCAHCEEEDQQAQRKEMHDSKIPAVTSTENYIATLKGRGRSLTPDERSFFEPRFGSDFSDVQLHIDAEANSSAKDTNALAYTHGNNIVFGADQYRPNTESGKNLLAHELTHTIQQKGRHMGQLQRCADGAANAQFDGTAAQVKAHAQYIALSSADKAVADDIMTRSRTRDDCMHFITRLLDLFTTPTNQSPAVGASVAGIIADAAQAERDRLATPEGARLQDIEERTVADPSRHMETINPPPRGWGHMATFRIDRSDVNNIVVQVKIKINAAPAIVANIQAQEDGIEKAAQQMGYILDVIFVNTAGPDVFQVNADPTQGVDAGNWGAYKANPSAYTHEIHHLIGLEDRYDYTVHAYNTRYSIPARLGYFRQQLSRPFDAHVNESLMGAGTQLLDDDICRVTQTNFATCMATRQRQRNALNTARLSAFAKCFRIFQSLANIARSSPVPHGDEMQDLRRRQIISKANLIFGINVNEEQLLDITRTTRNRLTPGINMRFAPSTDSGCTGNPYYMLKMTPPLVICPDFFTLSVEDQTKASIRAAAQLAGIDNSTHVISSGAYDCTTAGAGFNDADAWAKFVWCASAV